MADKISLDAGDEAENINVGKNNQQRVDKNASSNVNNVYLDLNNPPKSRRNEPITSDERTERLEQAVSKMAPDLERLVKVMDGVSLVPNNAAYQIRGLPAQLEKYMESDQDWKRATEARIRDGETKTKENDARIKKLEDAKLVVVAPVASPVDLPVSKGVLIFIIVLLITLVVFLLVLHFQGSGPTKAMMPLFFHQGYLDANFL